MRSLRQVLNAAVRWNLIQENPANRVGPNPPPRSQEVTFFESLASVDRLAGEMTPSFAPVVIFGVETGLRPSEWAALERRHVDRHRRVVKVRQAIVDRRLREYGKTARSRRDVPLTQRALDAVNAAPSRLDSVLVFPTKTGRHVDLDHWRRREWRPAVEAAGLSDRLTPYAMRHTFASFALDAGVSIFELSRVMGTSVRVIDEAYGHLVHDSLDRVRAALEYRTRRQPPKRA
jgi:integrase